MRTQVETAKDLLWAGIIQEFEDFGSKVEIWDGAGLFEFKGEISRIINNFQLEWSAIGSLNAMKAVSLIDKRDIDVRSDREATILYAIACGFVWSRCVPPWVNQLELDLRSGKIKPENEKEERLLRLWTEIIVAGLFDEDGW